MLFWGMDKGQITYILVYRLLDHGKPYLGLKGMTASYPKILDFVIDAVTRWNFGLSLLGRN